MDAKKEIVIINGTGGSGKDTFVSFVSKYRKVFNFSSVEKVKEIAKMIGWNGTKEEKDRKFLSDLKKLTTEYNDMSFKSIIEAIHSFLTSEEEIMFIHIREPEEISRLVNKLNGNVTTLLIKREGLPNISTNYSDASVDNYNYDYTITNRSLEELDYRAQSFAETILSSKETRGR